MELKTTAPDRGTDTWGCGDYGASRGSRTHKGIDKLVMAGSSVLSPISGKVTKLGYCYADDSSYRYVQVTDSNGFSVRLFYVEPSIRVGLMVRIGDKIGKSQNLGRRYNGMPNHVHIEIKNPDGKFIDPGCYEGAE